MMDLRKLNRAKQQIREESIARRNGHLRKASQLAVEARKKNKQERNKSPQLILNLNPRGKKKKALENQEGALHSRPLVEIERDLTELLGTQLLAQQKRWAAST